VTLVRRAGHDSPYLATLEGKIALRESGEGSAAESFRRAVNLAEAEHPQRDAWPHFFLGRTLLKLGKPEEAIDVLYAGEVIATERRGRRRELLIAIRTQLAIGYVLIGRLEQAKQILDLIASDDTGNPEVVWALALYRASAGEAGDSQELAQKTLQELDPKTAKDRHGRCQVYLFRALIYLGIGQSERASEEFSLAHREDPRNVFVLLRWARTLIDLARVSDAEGEHQAARACAEHAKSLADNVLRFDRNNGEALELLELLSDDFNVL
jgi:tetratricopeptide (TPR) repeat protein